MKKTIHIFIKKALVRSVFMLLLPFPAISFGADWNLEQIIRFDYNEGPTSRSFRQPLPSFFGDNPSISFNLNDKTVPLNDYTSFLDHQDFQKSMLMDFSSLEMGYTVRMTSMLSFGFSVNYRENRFKPAFSAHEFDGIGSPIEKISSVPFRVDPESEDSVAQRGLNANLGIMLNLSDRITFGAMVKTPLMKKHQNDLTKDKNFYSAASSTSAANTQAPFKYDEHERPLSYGVGLALRLSDKLTFAADLYRTEWEDYFEKHPNANGIAPAKLYKNEWIVNQIRMGAEYLIIASKFVIPLRGGLFYDAATDRGEPENIYGLSLGSGIEYGRFAIDLRYRYRTGDDVLNSVQEELDLSSIPDEHLFYSSFVIRY